MRNIIDDIKPSHSLLMQEINGMRVFLPINSDQYISPSDFLFTGRLNMQYGALNHPLKTECRLSVYVFVTSNDRRMFSDKIGERLAQIIHLCGTSAQHIGGRRV